MRALQAGIGPAGALVQVEIGISAPRRAALATARLPIPAPVTVTMLVDTGASHTFIDSSAIAALGLEPIDSVEYHSSSTNGVPAWCNVFDVSLALGRLSDRNLWRLDPFRLMGTAFIHHRHQGLLGQDVLDRVHLEWRGPERVLVIGYP